ncbi:MAG: indolepyruvate oxidoreductase subunit beta family protein [Xanthobacteraceae bacterium]
MSAAAARPISILIAALGGEGGGVLTDWIVAAAMKAGFPVQSTSIPGVAQRTGATTYYIEILPVAVVELEGKHPVLALAPGVGDVDLVLASELLEAGRAIAAGFVTRDRTLLIASTARSYLVVEKMAMADGRYDSARLLQAARDHAQAHLLLDMNALARRSGAMVNAVMLGIVAGCGRLPLAPDALEAAVRANGKAVDANLAGFQAGLAAARQADASPLTQAPNQAVESGLVVSSASRQMADWPLAARDVIELGVQRLLAYQGESYARLYLDRLQKVRAADERCNAHGRLLRDTARHLAVRMSYEDVIRVAQAKINPARRQRIAGEIGATPDEPFTVTEFLKPGIEELCSVLPPVLARRVLAIAERRGLLERAHWAMQVNTSSISGYMRFWVLAKLRRWRPHTYRYQEEQCSIEAWLQLIDRAARLSAELAVEIAECARLIKGYGDTYRRGSANWRLIESRIVRPVLAGAIALPRGIDGIASARVAALADPDGEALARCLTAIDEHGSLAVAAE